MAVDWEDYLPEVMPEVSGCPVQIAEKAIRNAAIQFCNQSRVWRERIVDVAITQAAGPLYTLDTTGTDGDSQIIAVHRVEIEGNPKPLSTIAKQQLDDQYLRDTEQRPWYFNCDSPPEIRYYPDPDTNYTSRVWAILKPTRNSTSGPDFLFNDWEDEIAAGAKATLMAMKERPWSNLSMVSFYRKEFINGWVEARIRDAKSNVQSSTFMQPAVKFGRYRNNRWFR